MSLSPAKQARIFTVGFISARDDSSVSDKIQSKLFEMFSLRDGEKGFLLNLIITFQRL